MQPDLTAMRRARLFELLRQQNLSQQVARRRHGPARHDLSGDEVAQLCALAAKSWSAPRRTGSGR